MNLKLITLLVEVFFLTRAFDKVIEQQVFKKDGTNFDILKFSLKQQTSAHRLWGIKRVCRVHSPKPRAEVYCFRLNFNISKLVY